MSFIFSPARQNGMDENFITQPHDMWDNFTRQHFCVKISHNICKLFIIKPMAPNAQATSDNPVKHRMLTALQRVLKPLIKLALAQGINYQMLLETLKAVFVQVAEEEFKLSQREQTDSRISLLTGLHRKDVHRLRNQVDGVEEQYALASIGAQLVGLWVSDAAYIDVNGKPKPLARLASMGGHLSFERLVERVSKDIRARPVLDEWLRVGVVHLDDNDCVCLNTDAFIPSASFEEKLFFFQQNIHDHAAATTHNLMNLTPPMLERCVYYDGLSVEDIQTLKVLAESQSMVALKAVNARAIELQSTSTSTRASKSNGEDKNQRFTFAMYFYHAKDDSETKSIYEDHKKRVNKID